MTAQASRVARKEEVVRNEYEVQDLWSYCAVSETCNDAELGEYHTYGIHVSGQNISDILHDVSPNRDVVARMIERFNRHQLSPVHFRDAVEDILLE